MMKSENNELAELLESFDVGAYLDREGIDYKETFGSRGQQYNIKTCPACGTSKWKVFLNVETGLGNCFSGDCELKFNKFSFVRAHLGAEKGRAVFEHIKQFVTELGWRPPRKARVVASVERGACKMPHGHPIPIAGRNLAYLKNRGFDIATAQYFGWQYCKQGLFAYIDNYGNTKFQDFSKRILIPVWDMEGQLVSFQGRDITGTSEKKYLFPNGFAATGVHLYNAHNVHDTTRIIVGEGVFDVAALKVAMDSAQELRDVVPIGTFGKHISLGSGAQIDKFRALRDRGVKEVTICWDGEITATDDAVKSGQQLLGLGLKVRIAMLPANCDPNEVTSDVVVNAFYSATSLTSANAVSVLLKRRMMNGK